MINNISRDYLSEISKIITSLTGLHFSESRLCDLERGIVSAAHDLDFTDTENFIEWLKSSRLTRRHIEILAGHLTIGETYFFREKEAFDVLETAILPELIISRQGRERRIRIWSAGCSTGEEPYSVAIVVSKLLPDLKDWNITILATDINPYAIEKASVGIYSEWSFRNTPSWVKEGYFNRVKNGRYELIPSIKKMVVFESFNLAEDTYPSLLNNTNAMDIIFCRNVLMYFSDNMSRKVVQGFYNSLLDGGWLFVSPTEAYKHISLFFRVVNFNGITLYRKDTKKARIVKDMNHRVIPSYQLSCKVEAEYKPPPLVAAEPEVCPDSVQSIIIEDIQKPKADEVHLNTYREAEVIFNQGLYGDAAERLEGLLLQNKGDPKITTLLLRAYANQGRLDNALKWCEETIFADKLNPVSYYLFAAILQEQGRFEDAIKSLKKAIYLAPDFVLAYFSLGHIMLRQGNFIQSKKYFKNVRDLLSALSPEEVIPESEGITAGRLSEVIDSMIYDR
ncbi:MAG: tetratricopeptide repeat protein [Nitrospinae bacterium]|nr:tetratricopeptide repeat protein [Nitrospinota bacterium]